MKKIATGFMCLALVGCGENQQITIFKNKPIDNKPGSKTIGSVLENKSVCGKIEWSKTEDEITYVCKLNNYDTVLKEIVTANTTNLEIETNKIITRYKEEIEIANFRIEQLDKVKEAFDELEAEGVIKEYNNIFNDLRADLIEEDVLTSRSIRSMLFDNVDVLLREDVISVIKKIRQTALKYGITEEFHDRLDYLELSESTRLDLFNRDKNKIKTDRDAIEQELNKVKKISDNHMDVAAKFTITPFIKRIEQRLTFSLKDEFVTIKSCQFNYTSFDDKSYTMDDKELCFNMAYESEYTKNYYKMFTGLFNQLLG